MNPYQSSSYYRRPNPGLASELTNFDELMDTLPAATGGVLMQRFALRQAGPFEPGAGGVMEPGIKHAIALWLGAKLGGQLIGSVMGSEAKGHVASIAALGFAGDLFITRRFARNSQWLQQNVSLQGFGDDDDEATELELSGFQSNTQLGDDSEYIDAMGNRWVQGAGGWQLSGMGAGQIVQGPDGTLYELSGFQAESVLGSGMGQAYPSMGSSFGYARA